MTDLRAKILIIALNINSLNTHREIGKVEKKYDQTVCHVQETHFGFNSKGRFKAKCWGKYILNIIYTNIKQTNARVSVLLSEEIDLRTNKITKDKKEQYTLIKLSIYHKDKGSNCVFSKQ